jgi:hypothetical protein
VRLAGIKQNALSGRRLAGVDMRHDTEVSVIFDLMDARHGTIPSKAFFHQR